LPRVIEGFRGSQPTSLPPRHLVTFMDPCSVLGQLLAELVLVDVAVDAILYERPRGLDGSLLRLVDFVLLATTIGSVVLRVIL
jgi:hypothetical protein